MFLLISEEQEETKSRGGQRYREGDLREMALYELINGSSKKRRRDEEKVEMKEEGSVKY